ncbi:hypothetical protein JOF29_002858 [Kribbella aluminosa]|uniref:YtkA-like domain-containing protein n=1 Tax=Kribbella aluminosa TaxID=416017 RepID=A0ABS4UJG9_9ACTN|nr:hypothetical protein [Kribbella aluminosa]MBP2351775.1 hypothetical protein [Kribbella aluminosa]
MSSRMPLRRMILAASVAVVLVASLLVLLLPMQPAPTVLHTGTARYIVTATVDNPLTGVTAIEFAFATRTASTASATAVDLEAVMPLMGHATESIRAVPLGGDRYRVDGVPLMMAGPWELLVSIEAGGTAEHLTLPLSVH